MEKMKYIITFLLLAFAFTSFAQDPCEDESLNEEVCVELAPGLVLPMPLCDALNSGLAIVDCDLVWEEEDEEEDEEEIIDECDCDWDTNEIICVSLFGDVIQVHPCEVECGFFLFMNPLETDFEIVDCGDIVYGCTDPNALNYNADATSNDGSCEYDDDPNDCDCDWESEEFVCVSFWGDVIEVHACEVECGFWDLGFGDEEIEIIDCGEIIYGCTDPAALNYNADATYNDGSCEYEDDPNDCDCDWESEEFVCVSFWGDVFEVHACEVECGFWDLGFGDEEIEIIDCGEIVYGCTDPNALNYNAEATANDGSCEYEDDPNECDCDWESEEYVCVSFWGDIFEVHACEVECGFWDFGFGDEEIVVVDCDELIYGCTDPAAENYDPQATANDGSCEYESDCDCDWNSDEYVCVDWGGGQISEIHICEVECYEWFVELDIVDCENIVYGCTDPAAENYDEDANVNDGSCTYVSDCDCDWTTDEVVCVDFGWGEIIPVHPCDLECGEFELIDIEFEIVDCGDIVYGCTDEYALNYDPLATVNDGSCEYEEEPECDCDWNTDEYVCVDFGWGEIIEVHPCELECFAWIEDYVVVDCGEGNEDDEEDEEDDIEDDLIEILEDFYGGGEFNQENFENLADIIIDLLVFPNPLDGDGLGIYVDSNGETGAYMQIFNGIGQEVQTERMNLVSGKNQLQLNLVDLEAGVYIAKITTDSGVSVSERFIKN